VPWSSACTLSGHKGSHIRARTCRHHLLTVVWSCMVPNPGWCGVTSTCAGLFDEGSTLLTRSWLRLLYCKETYHAVERDKNVRV
jgi:hypothetical protein